MSEQLKRPGMKRGCGDRWPPPPRTLLIHDEHQPCSALQVITGWYLPPKKPITPRSRVRGSVGRAAGTRRGGGGGRRRRTPGANHGIRVQQTTEHPPTERRLEAGVSHRGSSRRCLCNRSASSCCCVTLIMRMVNIRYNRRDGKTAANFTDFHNILPELRGKKTRGSRCDASDCVFHVLLDFHQLSQLNFERALLKNYSRVTFFKPCRRLINSLKHTSAL